MADPNRSWREFHLSDEETDDEFNPPVPNEATPLSNGQGSTYYNNTRAGSSGRTNSHHTRYSWKTIKTRTQYYIPVLRWLPNYSLEYLWSDIISGVTVACLIIPQGLSYATALARINAVHGLYGAFFTALFYSFFGTSRQLSMGPEAVVMMLVGSAISQQRHFVPDDIPWTEADAALLAAFLTFFVGLFLFLLGIFRLGFLDSLLSRALLRGFITAVGLVIFVEQLVNLTGLADRARDAGLNADSTTVERVIFLVLNVHKVHWLTTAVSFGSLAFLLVFKVLKTRFSKIGVLQFIPEILLVVVFTTILCQHFRWYEHGLQILGEVDGRSLPLPSIPRPEHIAHVRNLMGTASLISVIVFVESVVICKQYASQHNYSVSPNRELVAMGIANIFSGLFQGLPGGGSMARSRIADRAGAKTQLAGFVTAVLILMAIIFLLPYFYYLPRAVLSSIIAVAALSLVSETPHDLRFMIRIQAWNDLVLFAIELLATIMVSVETGTLLSIVLSLIIVIKHITYPRITILGRVQGTNDKYRPIKEFPAVTEHVEDVLIVKIEEPLFFANTGQLKERLRRLERFGDLDVHPSEDQRLGPIYHVVFDVENMPQVDASAIQILNEIVEAYHTRGVEVFFVKLRENSRELFARSGLIDMIGEDHICRRISDAMKEIKRRQSNTIVTFE
ncbi:uncharacterized protein VTP21DRAFT_531 [Calcarisporiella thermophila]|uniref:uncharacterized protein n=1 Tax=Calcarisporiella thermophila TaxID=911321 RepID=UPI0037427130